MLKRKKLVQVMQGKTATLEEYNREYERERYVRYPCIEDLEVELGFHVDQVDLLRAARVLACPVKRTPAHWAHGRVVYAVAREFASRRPWEEILTFLDIGTAKGFSAVMLAWALRDAQHRGEVISIDAVDPMDLVPRNSVKEIDGPLTVPDFVMPFLGPDISLCLDFGANVTRGPWEGVTLEFHGMKSEDFLRITPSDKRFHLAFVDGRHDYAHAKNESEMLAENQRPGDVLIFDDLQFEGVKAAFDRLQGYTKQVLKPLPGRHYAIARKR